MPEDLETENILAGQRLDAGGLVGGVERLGRVTPLTRPECNGSLWEMRDGELLRFRCHVGHAFSGDGLMAEQSDATEDALWSAVRALEEKMVLSRRMAERSRQRGLGRAAETFDERARTAERQADAVRQLLLSARDEPKADTATAELVAAGDERDRPEVRTS